MTFDEGLSQNTREKPSIAAGIMTTAGGIKKLPCTLDRDRDAQEAAARARVVGQRFYQALAPVLLAGVTFGPHRTIEWQKVTGTARHNGREESGKDARDSLKTAVWLKSYHNARVPGLIARFSFKNA